MTYAQFVHEYVALRGTGSLGIGMSTSFPNMEVFQNIHCLAHLYNLQNKGFIDTNWIGFPCTINQSVPYMPDMIFTNYQNVVSIQHKYRCFSPASQDLIRNWNRKNYVDILHLGVANSDIYLNQEHSNTRFRLWIQNYQYVNMALTNNSEELFKAFLNYKEFCNNSKYRELNILLHQNVDSIATIFNNNPMSDEKSDFINTFTSSLNILNE